MSIRSRVVRAGLILSLIGLSAGWAGAAGQDLTRLAPADTVLVVSIPDVPGLLKKWDDSPFYRFYDDPRAAAFFRPLRRAVEGFKASLSGVEEDRLWRFFSGGLVLAGVAAPPGSEDPVEWVLIFEHNGDAQILEKLQQGLADPGARVEQIKQNFAGQPYTQTRVIREVAADVPTRREKKKKHKKRDAVLDRPEMDLSLNLPTGGASAVQLKRQVVEQSEDYFGSSIIVHAGAKGHPLRQVLSLIARQAGTPSLGQTSGFKQLRQVMGGRGEIRVFANVAALAGWLERQQQEASPLGRVVDFGQLHLEEVKAVGVSMELHNDRTAFDVAVVAPPPRAGISRLLFPAGGEAPKVAPLAPAEAVGFSAVTYPVEDLWIVLSQTMQAASPSINLLVQAQLAGFKQNTGIDFQRDMIGRMGSSVARFMLPGKGRRGGDAPEDLTTYMVGLRDAAAFRDTLKSMLAYGAQAYGAYRVEPTKLGAWALWTIYQGGQAGPATQTGERPLFHFCVTDKWLLCGESRAGIEALAARAEHPNMPSLSGKPEFRRVMDLLPENRFGESYLNTGGLRALVEMGLLAQAPEHGKRKKHGFLPLNPDLLPKDVVWNDYFGPMGSAMSQQGDTLRLQAMVLYP